MLIIKWAKTLPESDIQSLRKHPLSSGLNSQSTHLLVSLEGSSVETLMVQQQISCHHLLGVLT